MSGRSGIVPEASIRHQSVIEGRESPGDPQRCTPTLRRRLVLVESAAGGLAQIPQLFSCPIYTSEAISRNFAKRFLDAGAPQTGAGVEVLSDRELDVFKRIALGKTTREIADSLHLSVKTIESYREHLKVKLELSSGAALSRCAILWMETGRLR